MMKEMKCSSTYQLQKQVNSELWIDNKTQVRTILDWSSTFPRADADSLVDRLSNMVNNADFYFAF